MTRQVAVALWLTASAVLAETGPVPAGRVVPYAAGVLDYAGVPPSMETIRAQGAAFLRVHFRSFHLAPGDALVVSRPDGGDLTRYRGRGPAHTGAFWSFSVPGDTAVLTLETSGAAPAGQGYGYEVDAIVHGDDAWLPSPGDDGVFSPMSVCGDDGSEDVACHLDEVGPAQRAVARLNYVSGGSSFVCTGWLVAGAHASTLVTNHHCIGSQADADTVEARFNYQMESCGGTALGTDARYAGGTLLRTSPGLDYSLLTLLGDPESVWGELVASARVVAPGTLIWLVQHPVGLPKKIGYWEDAAKTERCDVEAVDMTVGGYDPGTQIGYSCDSRGGSSGAPLILADSNEVIGLHHLGGCFNSATHMSAVCSDAGTLLACVASTATPSATPTVTPSPMPPPTPTPTPTPTGTPRPAYVEVTPTGHAVTATGHDGNVPANTVDDRLSTRWSAYGTGHQIRFDLGTLRTVGHAGVAVYRGDDRRNRFYLQVSRDGCAWKTVFFGYSRGTTTAEEIVDFPDETARYVRYVGMGAALHAGGTTAWNSVTEISLFAVP